MLVLLSLLLMGVGAQSQPPADPNAPGMTYTTKKSLADLQQCLTDRLTKNGDITAIPIDASTTTLMYRESTETPMLIDLSPPKVTVTTRFAYGTRHILESCL